MIRIIKDFQYHHEKPLRAHFKTQIFFGAFIVGAESNKLNLEK